MGCSGSNTKDIDKERFAKVITRHSWDQAKENIKDKIITLFTKYNISNLNLMVSYQTIFEKSEYKEFELMEKNMLCFTKTFDEFIQWDDPPYLFLRDEIKDYFKDHPHYEKYNGFTYNNQLGIHEKFIFSLKPKRVSDDVAVEIPTDRVYKAFIFFHYDTLQIEEVMITLEEFKDKEIEYYFILNDPDFTEEQKEDKILDLLKITKTIDNHIHYLTEQDYKKLNKILYLQENPDLAVICDHNNYIIYQGEISYITRDFLVNIGSKIEYDKNYFNNIYEKMNIVNSKSDIVNSEISGSINISKAEIFYFNKTENVQNSIEHYNPIRMLLNVDKHTFDKVDKIKDILHISLMEMNIIKKIENNEKVGLILNDLGGLFEDNKLTNQHYSVVIDNKIQLFSKMKFNFIKTSAFSLIYYLKIDKPEEIFQDTIENIFTSLSKHPKIENIKTIECLPELSNSYKIKDIKKTLISVPRKTLLGSVKDPFDNELCKLVYVINQETNIITFESFIKGLSLIINGFKEEVLFILIVNIRNKVQKQILFSKFSSNIIDGLKDFFILLLSFEFQEIQKFGIFSEEGVDNKILLLDSKNAIKYIGDPKNLSLEESLTNLLENKEITEAYQIRMNKHNFARFLKYISELNNFLTFNFIKENILYQPTVILSYKKILSFIDNSNSLEEFCDIRYTVIMKDTSEFETNLLAKTDKEFQNLKNQLGSYFNLKLLNTKIIEDSYLCDICGDKIEHEHEHYYNQFSSSSICVSCDEKQMNNPKRAFPFNTILLKYKNKKILKEIILDYYNMYKIRDKSYFAKDSTGSKFVCTVCTMPLNQTDNDVFMSLIHISNIENQDSPMFICYNCSVFVLNQDKLDKLAITSNFLFKKYWEQIKKNNIDTHNLVYRRIKIKEIERPKKDNNSDKKSTDISPQHKEGKSRKREMDRENKRDSESKVINIPFNNNNNNEISVIKEENEGNDANQKLLENESIQSIH